MQSNGDAHNRSLVILCEGQGDQAFFVNLIRTRSLPGFSVVFPSDKPEQGIPGGVDGFAGRLRALRAERDFSKIEGLLVVADNDSRPEASFTRVQQQLTEAGGYPVPTQPLEVARGESGPWVVVMMLPWIGQPGNLETLCVKAMRGAWPEAAVCLEEFCRCTSTSRWDLSKQSKMRLRAMISAVCESDPNTSLVYAWNRPQNLIPLNDAVFDEIAAYLSDFKKLVSQP